MLRLDLQEARCLELLGFPAQPGSKCTPWLLAPAQQTGFCSTFGRRPRGTLLALLVLVARSSQCCDSAVTVL